MRKKDRGLAEARQIYENRGQRAEELKAEGRKIAGYFCCYGPVELLAAAGYVPFRIQGDMSQPITRADSYLPTTICNFSRSCFDLALKVQYDFLDAFIGVHACDVVERTSGVWRSYIKYPCMFHLDIPHTVHPAAIEFFKKQLGYLKGVLEECSGKKVSTTHVKEAILLYNKQRALVRQLYDLRKVAFPPISATEVLQVMMSLMTVTVEEGNLLLGKVLKEVKDRTVNVAQKKTRVLAMGCVMDNIVLTNLIEESGLNIVMDDVPIGTRTLWHDIELTEDPLDGMASHYLNEIVCPQTFRDTGKTRGEDLENRFGYLRRFIKGWNINGVYMNSVRNCDIHGYEIPELRHYLEEMLGVPLLVVEHDYSSIALGPLRTRFQAFAERIEQKAG